VSDAWDDEDRAIAQALNVSDNDGGSFDERAVLEYREVLGHLPFDAITPPLDLEDRVVAAALARRPAAATALDGARTQRRSRRRAAALGAVAVAAAIIVAVLVTTRDSSSPTPKGRITAVATSRSDAEALLNKAGTRSGAFERAIGKVALARSGQGSLYDLRPSAVIGVWLDTKGGGSTSLGAALPRDGVIAFSVDRPDLVTAVRLTNPDGTDLARAPLTGR
jgi:hypothetical protein